MIRMGHFSSSVQRRASKNHLEMAVGCRTLDSGRRTREACGRRTHAALRPDGAGGTPGLGIELAGAHFLSIHSSVGPPDESPVPDSGRVLHLSGGQHATTIRQRFWPR